MGWTFSRAIPIEDANGEILEWFGAASDVTVTTQAGRGDVDRRGPPAMPSSVRTLTALFRAGIRSAELLFGYPAKEALGQPITLIIPPDRLGEETTVVENLRRGEHIDHYNTVRVDKSGRHINVSVTVSPIRAESGVVVGAAKTVRDITERKQVEEALHESEEQRGLGQRHPAVMLDSKCLFRYNQCWYQHTGTTQQQMEGWGWQSVHDAVELPKVPERWEASISKGEAFNMVSCRGEPTRNFVHS